MGCGNSNTSKQFSLTIKILTECIIQCKMDIKRYQELLIDSIDKTDKSILQYIIMYKNNHYNILDNLYKISTGNIPNLKIIDEKMNNRDFTSNINYCIESEFKFSYLIKSLYSQLPSLELRQAANSILIDENIICNKLIYINTRKK